jgi:hypothetical protein
MAATEVTQEPIDNEIQRAVARILDEREEAGLPRYVEDGGVIETIARLMRAPEGGGRDG